VEFAKFSEFRCPAIGCGREAKLVRATVEEFIHNFGGEKAACYIVQCAKHGQKLITIDLQPVTRQNRDPNRRRHEGRRAKGPDIGALASTPGRQTHQE
jgi:hypothetical protein